MKDDSLISRNAAIDAVAEGLKHVFVENQDIAEKMIGKLPSAQPERTETHACDYISRQAAVDALEKIDCSDWDGRLSALKCDAVDEAVATIKALPPAETKGYTKADYIMALHKEYGVDFARAEEAHNRALEYLRSTAMVNHPPLKRYPF